MLQKFDFTRDIIVLIERAGVKGADMYEHIPLRNILDPGSKESFINRKILKEHKMDPAKIRQLSEEEQQERTLLTLSGSPPYTHPRGDAVLASSQGYKSTAGPRFLVVDNDDVDVVIGSSLCPKPKVPAAGPWPFRDISHGVCVFWTTELEDITKP